MHSINSKTLIAGSTFPNNQRFALYKKPAAPAGFPRGTLVNTFRFLLLR
jgi:hypothetical protein